MFERVHGVYSVLRVSMFRDLFGTTDPLHRKENLRRHDVLEVFIFPGKGREFKKTKEYENQNLWRNRLAVDHRLKSIAVYLIRPVVY